MSGLRGNRAALAWLFSDYPKRLGDFPAGNESALATGWYGSVRIELNHLLQQFNRFRHAFDSRIDRRKRVLGIGEFGTLLRNNSK